MSYISENLKISDFPIDEALCLHEIYISRNNASTYQIPLSGVFEKSLLDSLSVNNNDIIILKEKGLIVSKRLPRRENYRVSSLSIRKERLAEVEAFFNTNRFWAGSKSFKNYTYINDVSKKILKMIKGGVLFN